MDLRDNISERRRAAGLTQEDVAARLGVSRQTVGKWESGRATPELEKLIALCDLLGCSLDELVGRTEAEITSAAEAASTAVNVPIAVSGTSCTDALASELPDDESPALHGTAARYAALLCAGIWLIAAAVGLFSLLLGPSSVDNVEVRRIVPYAIALGIGIGVVLVVASRVYHLKCLRAGATSAASARRCRAAAVFLLLVIAVAICALASLAPGMRTTTFICLEILALAAWPVVLAAVLTIDSRR
ncbi:MAG: helix-turn-helix transcriptional regulator [Actinomycetota bacterium]|nr:helix-turn-helix transcriptional regulator [Actinomycetota bacterium]